MPGTRKLKSTKLQMAEEEAKEARQSNVILLLERVDRIESDFQSLVTTLKDEFLQMKRMMLQSNVGQNLEFNPRYGLSHNRVDEDEDEDRYEDEDEHEDSVGSATANREVQRKKETTILQKKSEGALLQKKVMQERNATLSEKKKAAIQQDKDVALHHNKISTSIRKEVAITQKNHQQGKNVILYSVYRDHGSPVAKTTILSIDRREEVGGQELGSEYCKVVVNYVIKRDAILPRGIGNMTTMGQAQGRYITWPYKHLEVDKSIAKAAMRPQAS